MKSSEAARGEQYGFHKTEPLSPTQEKFSAKYVIPNDKEHAEESKIGEIYALFMQHTSEESGPSKVPSERGQLLLEMLLEQIDLAGHFEWGREPEGRKSSSPAQGRKLLDAIFDYPMGFVVDPEREIPVKLLAAHLRERFMDLSDAEVAEVLQRQEATAREQASDSRLLTNLRMLATTLNSRLSSINESSTLYRDQVIIGLYAGRFISHFEFFFDICKDSVKDSKSGRKASEHFGYSGGLTK